jgi:hypothetical protein
MTLFPRKIGGRYVMLGRQDAESIYLMFSDHLHFWHSMQLILQRSPAATESNPFSELRHSVATRIGGRRDHLEVRVNGDHADIVCNECEAVIRTVPLSNVEAVVLAMDETDTICTAVCTALWRGQRVSGDVRNRGVHLL